MKRECILNFAPKDIGYNGEMQSPPTLPDDPYFIPFPVKDASKFEMIGQRNDTNLIGTLVEFWARLACTLKSALYTF